MFNKSQVIRDFILFAVFGLAGALLMPTNGYAMMYVLIFIGCGFFPFGWRWASNIITAVSLYGIVMKAAISIVLGVVAGPVTLGKDIISLVSFARD
ncbi:MAG: hypothetical protein K6G27_07930 [Lachnospiraceae bacterium]|nr:hypothetical protein [Lachnospiraceae bacterium]